MNDPIREAHDAMIRKATNEGKVMELGFLALTAQMLAGASPNAIHSARMLYMAGAQHLFASIMGALDPESDPTADDIRRMSLIAAELDAITPHLNAWATGPSKGPVQ